MKKMTLKPKLKLPNIRRKSKREAAAQTPREERRGSVPRITTETVAAHREEVLSSARKYIYPLQHSKHKIVLISTALFITTVVAFFSYCLIALYRLQSTSTFLYGVTQVIPFPIAKAGPHYVAYENYLFELRHYMHYYETQQKLDFNTESGKQQLADFKQRALTRVVDDAFVKQLAAKNKVSVSDQEVNDEITIVRNQNRLGGSDKVFEDVLKDFWGWSVDDFKRELRSQLLAQKLVSTLDTGTHARAQAALDELKGGADFAAVAKKYSDDASTKDNGGDFSGPINKTNIDLPAQTLDALFRLAPGQTSDIINVGYGLEIVRVRNKTGDTVQASHILFNFKDISTYLNDYKDTHRAHLYVKV